MSVGADVTQKCREIVCNKGELKADNGLFGDPCLGIVKTLVVELEECCAHEFETMTFPKSWGMCKGKAKGKGWMMEGMCKGKGRGKGKGKWKGIFEPASAPEEIGSKSTSAVSTS